MLYRTRTSQSDRPQGTIIRLKIKKNLFSSSSKHHRHSLAPSSDNTHSSSPTALSHNPTLQHGLAPRNDIFRKYRREELEHRSMEQHVEDHHHHQMMTGWLLHRHFCCSSSFRKQLLFLKRNCNTRTRLGPIYVTLDDPIYGAVNKGKKIILATEYTPARPPQSILFR